MECALCNGTVREMTERIEIVTRSLGKISSPMVKYKLCNTCGEKLLDPTESTRIANYIRKREQELIDSLPISGFLSANEAADYLRVSKQAFSQNMKIKHGVIYSAQIGKKKFYSKKSLEKFKSTGNGKFLLEMPCTLKTIDQPKVPQSSTALEAEFPRATDGIYTAAANI